MRLTTSVSSDWETASWPTSQDDPPVTDTAGIFKTGLQNRHNLLRSNSGGALARVFPNNRVCKDVCSDLHVKNVKSKAFPSRTHLWGWRLTNNKRCMVIRLLICVYWSLPLLFCVVVSAILVYAGSLQGFSPGCRFAVPRTPTTPGSFSKELLSGENFEALKNHSKQFERQILKVSDSIYVGIGYGLANCVVINGQSGLIVVDTMESIQAMRSFWNEWKQTPLGKRPVHAIIYTHFHSDHIFGSSVVYENNVTEVWAHLLTDQEIEKVFQIIAGVTYERSMRQFGTFLTEEDGFVNSGIGHRLQFSSKLEMGFVPATHIWEGARKLASIAGEQLELVLAPGESKDHVVIWYEKERVLIGGDNVYKSFPNIYAIRGTETRNALQWVDSLDIMRKFPADHLVLGHGLPVSGKASIGDILTAYRDAIQFVHDQTVRLMNKGYFLSDIEQLVLLPPHLREHPFLQPMYGTVQWAVRAVFSHYLGWFSGSAEDLTSIPTLQRAKYMAALAGGQIKLLEAAKTALSQGDMQWALELSSHAYYLDPDSQGVREVRISALKNMASNQTCSSGRNWYLTSALEMEGKINLRLGNKQKKETVRSLRKALQIFDFLPVRLKAEEALGLDIAIEFEFTDTGEKVCTHIRRGVAYSRGHCEKDPEIQISTTDTVWRAIVSNDKSLIVAIASGEFIMRKGSYLTAITVFRQIEFDVE